MNKNIQKIMDAIAAQEMPLQAMQFLAPCARGGQARVKISGVVRTFQLRPDDFEGWGIYQPVSVRIAEVVEEASLPLVMEYLHPLPSLRLRLAFALRGQTWLAYPALDAAARHHLGAVRPIAVHLVTEGETFEPIFARGDGGVWWFEMRDHRADPLPAEYLQDALRCLLPPESVRFPGMTQEMRAVYRLAKERFSHGSLPFLSDPTVLGSGVCLSDSDLPYNLSSLITRA